jgi:hypothetical protein
MEYHFFSAPEQFSNVISSPSGDSSISSDPISGFVFDSQYNFRYPFPMIFFLSDRSASQMHH